MIDIAKWAMDVHKARQAKPDVTFENNNYKFEWWTWCDALFMAPPSFARMYQATGDSTYLKYAINHWWLTSDYLYSKEDSLFFRDDRFFNKKSENGKKVFWCRGNGWVVAGLARMLNIIPKNDSSRTKFEEQFKEMAHKLLNCRETAGCGLQVYMTPNNYLWVNQAVVLFLPLLLHGDSITDYWTKQNLNPQ